MCHRMRPLTLFEAEEAIRGLRETGRARVPRRGELTKVPDAYPGKQLPLFVPNESGELEAVELTWGFAGPAGSGSRLVFNTRIETALAQAESGRGMWAGPITTGRCLVPVRGFFEWTTRLPRDQRTQVGFSLPGHRVFLLAGVYDAGRFSVVTTKPNADVAPIHNRMPLVLGPGESGIWLGPGFATLADRSRVRLERGG